VLRHRIVSFLFVQRAHDIIHAVRAQVIAPPLRRAEQEQRLDVRAPQYGIQLARFALWEELQRLGELLLHVKLELFGAGEGEEDVL
jgi:hypothetical protein